MAKTKTIKRLALSHADLDWVRGAWPQASNSVAEVSIINLVQFLTPAERIHFVNELHRVLMSGARAELSVPHWASSRAYGDLAFQSPPVSESWLHHLNADWRAANAPWGKDYTCDFIPGCGYGMHPDIVSRNQEYQMHALTFWKEAAQDMVATLTKK